MPPPQLGTLETLTLRRLWPASAGDFTLWLVRNLHQLGSALRMDLEVVEREGPEGWFHLGVLARDTRSGKTVAIAAAMGETSHDDIGRLSTYAASRGARVLIVLADSIRSEHRGALDWLQRWLPCDLQIFGVEARALRIDDSRPAIEFVPVVVPDAWSRQPDDGLRPRSRQYRDFFQPVIEKLWDREFTRERSYALARSDQPFASGTDGVTYHASLEGSGAWVYVWVSTGDRNRNSAVFEALRAHEAEIARELQGADVRWTGQPGNRVPASMGMVMEGAAIDDPPENLALTQAWMIDALPTFKAVIHPRLETTVSELAWGDPSPDARPEEPELGERPA